MKSCRDRWVFFRHPTKPPLTSQEISFWKRQATSNAKIGMEFELNLKEQKGSCKGDSNACPCSLMKTEKCWEKCANEKACFAIKSYEKCVNKAVNCEPEDCQECQHFSVECAGMYCTEYVAACVSCSEFQTNCSECDLRYDPNKNPDNVRQKVKQLLDPSECYGMMNASGVHSITTDGSLLGNKGIEVITNGRRVDYWEYFKMAQEILKVVTRHGGWLNERCSIHMHLLLAYYQKLVQNGEKFGIPQGISEMERNMPEIILANLHQLVRRYQNAITWMTMGLEDPAHMTRWEKFRVSVLPVSAVLNSMPTVCREVSNHAGGNKYGWINYKYIRFARDNSLERFHVEFRVMDGMLSPSVIASVACLYFALLVKAIEISRYGILEVGDAEWMKRTEEVKEQLLNGRGDYGGSRFGNTKNLMRYKDILIDESLDLVHQVKHILIKIGPAYQVLEKLAETPVALLRVDGKSWEEVESYFAIETSKEDLFEIRLKEYIDLRFVNQCQNVEEWISAVGENLKADAAEEEFELPEGLEELILRFITDKKNDGEMIWSDTLGTMINV